ncbi:MAG: MFS transporter, partial [Candidatus Limnocylindrales bacterium]
MKPYLDLLRREKDFRRTYLGQLIALGGDWFAIVPLLILLPSLTGSGVWGAMVLAVDTLVFALVGPYAGTVVDRLDRR